MTPEQRRLAYELITNPPPRSRIEVARQHGVDLEALCENVQLTPTERAFKFSRQANTLEALRASGKLLVMPSRDDDPYILIELEALMELKQLTGAV